MNKKNIIKYILDIFLSLGFVLLFDKMALGMKLHEIIGLVIGGAVLIHLALNYKWIIGISKKIFSKELNNKLRISYILNIMLFICFTLIIISGVLISKTIITNISSQNRIWKVIHIGVPNITLCLIGIHIGLHWNWIMNMSKKLFKLNLPEKFSRVISMFLVIVILIFGCYNIYSKRFIQKSVMLFTASQNVNNGYSEGMKNLEGRPSFHKDNMTEEELNKFKAERENMNSEDFEKIKEHNNSKRKPSGNNMNKTSIVMMVINYLSICGVFTIITYYIDKTIKNKKSSAK